MIRDMKRKIRWGGKPVTVIVLAGGRGIRMNAEKASLPVRGETLLERVLGQVAPSFDEVLLSVSPGQKIVVRPNRMSEGRASEPKMVVDEMPGQGPMAGILAGLKAAENDLCAVVACDIPDVPVPILRKLVRAVEEAEIAVTVTPTGQFEPLFAVYTKAVIPKIEKLLRSGNRSLIPLFSSCRTELVRLEDTGRLKNINTRKDYEAYLKSLGSK